MTATTRALRRIKFALIDRHCAGQLPAWVLRLAFRLLPLKHL